MFTGKGLSFGGSLIRPEATGYGLVYFTDAMLQRHGLGFEGMRVAVSGSGNVAQYTIEKALELDARVITVSDSGGTLVDEDGFTTEKLAHLAEIKNQRYGRVADYARERGLTYLAGQQPWSVPVDIALPCATQNELDLEAAQTLIRNGVKAVAEGANMPTTIQATDAFLDAGVLFAPGKAATPAAWPPRGWRWRKTPRASAGGRKSGCTFTTYHGGYSPCLRGIRRRGQANPLCTRREYRRFRQGCGGDAGAGRAVIGRKGDLVHTSIKCFNAGLCAGIFSASKPSK